MQELPVGDPMEPASQRSPPLKRVKVAPGLQKRLLGQILRQVRSLGEIQQVAVDPTVVLADELVTCLGIPRAELLQKARIGVWSPLPRELPSPRAIFHVD